MATLHCTRYPQLRVVTPTGAVQFRDGLAHATSEQAESILGLSAKHGITVSTEQEPGAYALQRPSPQAPKAEWLAYADHQDPADHSAMTKAELIDQYGG
ncbi:hypothetical protein U9R90_24965 [Streptomyces sp. E11-3]|uniref:hypothetical protein n=1 Tax=Streptomyces sp. E11-3 TaxID=3110112 RepID=UPI0039814E7A